MEQYQVGLRPAFGYTGEQADVSGLIYLRARYYDPRLGAFTTKDPFEGVMTRSGSLNGYSYVEGNPVNYTDPSGRCWGPASFLRNTAAYGTTCNNMDMAWTIATSSQANGWDRFWAGAYFGGEIAAHIGVVAGLATACLAGGCAALAQAANIPTAVGLLKTGWAVGSLPEYSILAAYMVGTSQAATYAALALDTSLLVAGLLGNQEAAYYWMSGAMLPTWTANQPAYSPTLSTISNGISSVSQFINPSRGSLSYAGNKNWGILRATSSEGEGLFGLKIPGFSPMAWGKPVGGEWMRLSGPTAEITQGISGVLLTSGESSSTALIAATAHSLSDEAILQRAAQRIALASAGLAARGPLSPLESEGIGGGGEGLGLKSPTLLLLPEPTEPDFLMRARAERIAIGMEPDFKKFDRGFGNIAIADYSIEGIGSGSLIANSGTKSAFRTVELLPASERVFKTFKFGVSERYLDTEAKLLERLAKIIGVENTEAIGTIYLFTERYPCPSCGGTTGVIPQFAKKFPNIRLIVLSGEFPHGERLKWP